MEWEASLPWGHRTKGGISLKSLLLFSGAGISAGQPLCSQNTVRTQLLQLSRRLHGLLYAQGKEGGPCRLDMRNWATT